MPYTAKHRFARMSATKVRPVASMVRAKPVHVALDVLRFSPKRGARLIEKVLRSALANAGAEAEAASMKVSDIRIDTGPIATGTKRWKAGSRGMARPIRKRTCHITVTIDQAVVQEEV